MMNDRDILQRPTVVSPLSIQSNDSKRFNLSLIQQTKLLDKEINIIDEHLNESFKYFRNEFIEAAVSAAVTIPLDIIEDKTYRLYNFIKFDGPKYILQMIPNNIDNNHLIRSSLSLLIVTVNILTRKLPNEEKEKRSISPLSMNKSKSMTNVNISESITQWAIESLHQIIQNGNAISICINLLNHTIITNIHELTLKLLNSLILISDDALIQMFNQPNSFHYSDIKPYIKYNHFNNYLLNKSNHSKAIDLITNKNKQIDMLTTRLPTNLSPNRVRRGSNSSKTTSSKSNIKPLDSNSYIYLIPGCCLSILLHTIKLNRNKHVIMCGYCDIVVSMISYSNVDNIESLCNTIAQMTAYNNTTNTIVTTKKNKSNDTIKWDGIKLPILFLARYMNNNNELLDDYISNNQKIQLYNTFKQILLAISYLISGSIVVCNYITTLPNVMNILQLTYDLIKSNLSSDENHIITRCFDDINELNRNKNEIDNDLNLTIHMKTNKSNELNPIKRTNSSKSSSSPSNHLTNNSLSPGRSAFIRNTLLSSLSHSEILERRKTLHRMQKLLSNDHQTFSTDPFSPDYMYNRVLAPIDIHTARLTLLSKNNTSSSIISSTLNKTLSTIPSYDVTENITRRPSTTPSFEFSKHKPVYNNPESPKRKGLSPIYQLKQSQDLNKSFFDNLPDLPNIPNRLNELDYKHKETVIDNDVVYDNNIIYDLNDGEKLLDQISNKVVNKMKKEGVVVSGRNLIPLVDRIKDVYKPTEFIKPPVFQTAAGLPNQLKSQQSNRDKSSRRTSREKSPLISRESMKNLIISSLPKVTTSSNEMDLVEAMNILGFKLENDFDSNVHVDKPHIIDNHSDCMSLAIIDEDKRDSIDHSNEIDQITYKTSESFYTEVDTNENTNTKSNESKPSDLANRYISDSIANPSVYLSNHDDDSDDEISHIVYSRELPNKLLYNNYTSTSYKESLSHVIRKSSTTLYNNDELDQSISDLLIQSNDIILY